MPDNKDTSEQSKTPEQPARAGEQKGFFSNAAGKIGLGDFFNRMRGDQPEGHAERSDLRDSQQKARKIREELNKQPKGITLEPIPEQNRFSVLNQLTGLPVAHQMEALRLIYREKQMKQDRNLGWGADREITDAQELQASSQRSLLRHQIMTDQFALATEPDATRREAAERLLTEQAQMREKAYQQENAQWKLKLEEARIHRPQEYRNMTSGAPRTQLYEPLPTAMLSPEVAQSRETMLKILQALEWSSGRQLSQQLHIFDRTKSGFDDGYEPHSQQGLS